MIAKGTAYGERKAAQRNARDRQRQREYLEAQGEQEREFVDRQVLGMILGGGGLVRPLPSQPMYQPPLPVPLAPVITITPPRQPLNCTSQAAGNMLYTNCY